MILTETTAPQVNLSDFLPPEILSDGTRYLGDLAKNPFQDEGDGGDEDEVCNPPESFGGWKVATYEIKNEDGGEVDHRHFIGELTHLPSGQQLMPGQIITVRFTASGDYIWGEGCGHDQPDETFGIEIDQNNIIPGITAQNFLIGDNHEAQIEMMVRADENGRIKFHVRTAATETAGSGYVEAQTVELAATPTAVPTVENTPTAVIPVPEETLEPTEPTVIGPPPEEPMPDLPPTPELVETTPTPHSAPPEKTPNPGASYEVNFEGMRHVGDVVGEQGIREIASLLGKNEWLSVIFKNGKPILLLLKLVAATGAVVAGDKKDVVNAVAAWHLKK